MKLLTQTLLVNGEQYLINRWKPAKGRAYYQLFKYSKDEKDFIYYNKDFASIKQAEKYLRELEK